MRLLDLYAGAGGAACGYARAGFEVVGVDHVVQPNYPYEFHLYDALALPPRFIAERFDAVHASPPCQAHSSLKSMWNARDGHLDLIAETRDLLIATGLPYVIENVVGARKALREPVMICGSSVGLPLIQRHRLFEANFPIMVAPCAHNQGEKVFPSLTGTGRRAGGKSRIVGVYGAGGDKRAHLWPEAMGIDWMTRRELTQAIPPAYTELIGAQLMQYLIRTAA